MIRFSVNMTDDEMELLMREIDEQDRAYQQSLAFSENEFCGCDACEEEWDFIEKAKLWKL